MSRNTDNAMNNATHLKTRSPTAPGTRTLALGRRSSSVAAFIAAQRVSAVHRHHPVRNAYSLVLLAKNQTDEEREERRPSSVWKHTVPGKKRSQYLIVFTRAKTLV